MTISVPKRIKAFGDGFMSRQLLVLVLVMAYILWVYYVVNVVLVKVYMNVYINGDIYWYNTKKE